ncbi:uncharacterized protein BDR25DRAFT_355551 [Lindgomyces ingoldianus]|uniref:Uncharacterized protein n=1 Tax=Lindgomyces ingoldianus TaxID=673940 RepID=A0ACB6QUB7_9PLEO|nr:uncharacterized protein BDR25DRAFT_355551 [Lindgomyces ingoldianus]KAF2470447.1 hypothetical protein BDR25DRAFT_355551 [Lindgomyces ingoldianus]
MLQTFQRCFTQINASQELDQNQSKPKLIALGSQILKLRFKSCHSASMTLNPRELVHATSNNFLSVTHKSLPYFKAYIKVGSGAFSLKQINLRLIVFATQRFEVTVHESTESRQTFLIKLLPYFSFITRIVSQEYFKLSHTGRLAQAKNLINQTLNSPLMSSKMMIMLLKSTTSFTITCVDDDLSGSKSRIFQTA